MLFDKGSRAVLESLLWTGDTVLGAVFRWSFNQTPLSQTIVKFWVDLPPGCG
jgi:hypothetical protein